MSPRKCFTWTDEDGSVSFMSGSFPGVKHCADCGDMGILLCDYPVGRNKTCDRSMCERHAMHVGKNLDYCPAHYAMWEAHERERGAIAIALPHEREPDCWLVCECGVGHPWMTSTAKEMQRTMRGTWPKHCGKRMLMTLREPLKVAPAPGDQT